MANRYWVGGTASWDGTAGTKWAVTSGGAGGLAIPTTADDVFFDANSGASTVSISTGNTGAKTVTCTGFTGSFRGNGALTVAGSFILSSTMTGGWTGLLTLTGTGTLTTAGINITAGVTINGTGIVVTLGDAFLTSSGAVNLTAGTLNLSSYTITCASFNASNGNVRTLAFGTGAITVAGNGAAFTTASTGGFNVTGTPTVNITNSGAVATSVFVGNLTSTLTMNFNFTAGTYSLTFLSSTTNSVRSVDFTGFAGTLGAIGTTSIYGDLKLSTGMTLTSSANLMSPSATSGTQNFTTNGKTISFPITLNASGATLKLLDALTMASNRNFTHTNGTLDLNGNTLTAGSAAVYQTAVGTKNLTFNGGTLVCPAASSTAFSNVAPTNFTTTAGTGTGKISMTAALGKTFAGGGSAYNCTISNDGAGALTITGNNTFTTIENGVSPTSFSFANGSTTTLTNWNVSGTAGNLVTIGSPVGTNHTLSKSTGTVSSDYLSILRSTATGGATWYAGANSTDGGSNSGWIFTAPPSVAAGKFFTLLFN